VATEQWLQDNVKLTGKHKDAIIASVSEQELQAVSQLQKANEVLLVVYRDNDNATLPAGEWCIALDTLQDPGNMGTIIRIADWFGIGHVVATPDSVDFYNPKVIQAAMGGHLRVRLHSADILQFIAQSDVPVYAAALDGDNIYELKDVKPGVIVIGNESKGISAAVMQQATKKITIPRIGGAESLNAAVSAGIICALLIKP
jgi:TrmH family RNA methyltransferase